jgi:hypothetical protein
MVHTMGRNSFSIVLTTYSCVVTIVLLNLGLLGKPQGVGCKAFAGDSHGDAAKGSCWCSKYVAG